QGAVARGGTTVDAGKIRLRQNRRQRQYGRVQAIGADTENSAGIDSALPGALAGPARSDALHDLSDADSVGGHSGHPDALRASVNSGVAAAQHGLAAAENVAQDAAVETRIPSRRQARADAAVERIEWILGFRGDVLYGREGN